MRRRQQFLRSALEAQKDTLKAWARRAVAAPAKEVAQTELPTTASEMTPPDESPGAAPVAPLVAKPGFCLRCGKHIGQGVWMHQKTCKGLADG